MVDILPIVSVVALILLTITLVVVGVQLFLVLRSLQQVLGRVNEFLDETEEKIEAVTAPLQNLAGIASGLKTGVKVFEGFVQFLNRKKQQTNSDHSKTSDA